MDAGRKRADAIRGRRGRFTPQGARAVAALLACLMLAEPATAAAQWSSKQCLGELSEEEVRGRLSYIEEAFEEQEQDARRWWYGWMAGNAALVAGNVFMVMSDCDLGPIECPTGDDRASNIAGALGAAATLGNLLAVPFAGAYAGNRIEKMPENTREQLHEKLRFAEHMLMDASFDAWLHINQLPALVGYVALTSSILPTVWDEGAWDTASLAVTAVALTTARMATVPWSIVEAREAYVHASNPCMAPYLKREQPEMDLSFSPTFGGVQLGLTW